MGNCGKSSGSKDMFPYWEVSTIQGLKYPIAVKLAQCIPRSGHKIGTYYQRYLLAELVLTLCT